MRSEGYPLSTINAALGSASTPSPLNDINPADISRVEIIKGPAASTLYGTDASAGVIQIFTKRGAAGRARWTLGGTWGREWAQKFGPTRVPHDGTSPTHYDGYLGMAPYLKTKRDILSKSMPNQLYDLSVAGGREDLQYYVSGSVERNRGIQPSDSQFRFRARSNLTFAPGARVTIAVSNSFTSDRLSNTPSGGSGTAGLTTQRVPDSKPAYLWRRREYRDILEITDRNENAHLVSGLTVTHFTTRTWSNKITVGYDRATNHYLWSEPYGLMTAGDSTGRMFNRHWVAEIVTLDYLGTFDRHIGGSVTAQVAWGGQSARTIESQLEARGLSFPGPGDFTVSGAGTKFALADERRVVNAGLFGQAKFGFWDRLFVTAGLRVDGNSAFAKDFGLQSYPKMSAAYVVSDEAFWPKSLGDLKVRAAFGLAGRAAYSMRCGRGIDTFVGGRSGFIPQSVET
jgi:outer membrane receptor protein involved in Fe transport